MNIVIWLIISYIFYLLFQPSLAFIVGITYLLASIAFFNTKLLGKWLEGLQESKEEDESDDEIIDPLY